MSTDDLTVKVTADTAEFTAAVATAKARLLRERIVTWIAVGVLLSLTLLAAAYVYSRTHPEARAPSASVAAAQAPTPPPPLPHTHITIEESTGGKESVTGTSEGASVRLNGEKVEGKDLVVSPTHLDLADIGALTGGAFSGSLSASVSGMLWIRIGALLLSLGMAGLAVWNFKSHPLDWHYWAGLAVGSLACLLVAANPELLYVGLAGVLVAVGCNLWPSIAAKVATNAAFTYDDFVRSDASLLKRFEQWSADRNGPVSAKDRKDVDTIARRNV